MPPARPRLHWGDIALVGIGGTFGTAARYLASEGIPGWQGMPVATFVINVVGAFALGLLLERLVRAGSDVGIRHSVRLGVGTGFLGGFTTYSALAVDTEQLAAAGHPGVAVLYAALTVVVGAVATVLGILAAGRRRTGRIR
jgi:fluoride exporter